MVEDYYLGGFSSGYSTLARQSKFVRRDSRTTQSSAEHAYGPAFRSGSVISITAHLEIVFDTARYVLPFLKMVFYFD